MYSRAPNKILLKTHVCTTRELMYYTNEIKRTKLRIGTTKKIHHDQGKIIHMDLGKYSNNTVAI